jgi:hypothetical protein
MSMKVPLLVAAIWLTCTAVAFGQDRLPMAKAELHNGQGESVGIVTLEEGKTWQRWDSH